MREILFRGKRTDNGKWVEGFYYSDTPDSFLRPKVQFHYIRLVEPIRFDVAYAVIPETVGQWTGLLDKNGTKIFEGDLVKRVYFNSFLSEEVLVNCEVKWNRWNWSLFQDGEFYSPFDSAVRNQCEVIGNIHENENQGEKV